MKYCCKKLKENNSSLSNWRKITKDVTLSTKIIDFHDQIKCLKNAKLELSDKVQDFENTYIFDVV